MKRSELRKYEPGSAPYVTLHGVRQIKRGRRPSLAFRNVRNPEQALKFAALAWSIEFEVHTLREPLWPELSYIERGVYGIDGLIGCSINQVLESVKRLARAYRDGEVGTSNFTIYCGNPLTLVTDFNGVKVHVRHDSDVALLRRDWNRAHNGYIGKNVGPYPKPELSEEELANDQRIEAENEARRQARDEEYRRKARAKREQFEQKLAAAPPMEVSDEEAWADCKRKNDDSAGGPMGPGYGARIISYAEEWARLMQAEMAAGKQLEDIADDTASEADYDGISGAMYGASVAALAQHWVHGERLRVWHNKRYERRNQSVDNGGVVNPAFITIG